MFGFTKKMSVMAKLLAVLALALTMMVLAGNPAQADDGTPVDVPTFQCPDGTETGDTNGDGVADATDCDRTIEPPFNCPDGSTPEDDNGDGVLTIEDCVIVVCQEGDSHCQPPVPDACPKLEGDQPKGADCTPTTSVSHPTVAPLAGGAEGGNGLGGALASAGALLFLFCGALVMSRRRGSEA